MTASDSIATPRLYWRAVLPIALAALVLHVLTAPRYGYFRDEFYILACGRHLDWGYVDHAPLVALIARITSLTLGTSLYALRFVTGCSAAGKVMLTALIARELGGDRFAQVLAALTVLLVPVYLAIDNQFSLNTWEPLFWIGTVWIVLRSIRLARPKLLLWAGVLAGLGLENKHSTVFLLFALAAGLLLTPARRLFREPYFYAALGIAFVLFLPNLIWQYTHSFATLEFLHQVNATHKNVELPPARFVLAQVMMLSPVNAILWFPGLYFLVRRTQFRFLGFMYLALLILLMLLHAKDYYVAPIYPMLFAAGAVFWSTKPWRIWVPVVVILAGLPIIPAVLPIFPPERVPGYMAALGIAPGKTEVNQAAPLPQYFSDQFGWPEIAQATADTYRSLSATEQAHTAIYTGSYGDAGALELYGPALALPRILSAHNTYWYWGQDAEASTLILVNSERLIRDGRCTSVTDGPQISHPLAMEMEHFRIRVCHGLKQPLPELWPTLKHLAMTSTLKQLVLDSTALLFDIPEAIADAPREGRTWTRKQELGHLIDSAMNNHNRVVRAALDGEYTGPFYDADGWVEMNAYAELQWLTVITLWRDLNLQLDRVISRVPEDWLSSPCHIGDNPPATLGWLITDYSAHMQHHLSKILG